MHALEAILYFAGGDSEFVARCDVPASDAVPRFALSEMQAVVASDGVLWVVYPIVA